MLIMQRILLALVVCLPLIARGATLDKPVYAEVFLKNTNEKLTGNVTQRGFGRRGDSRRPE